LAPLTIHSPAQQWQTHGPVVNSLQQQIILKQLWPTGCSKNKTKRFIQPLARYGLTANVWELASQSQYRGLKLKKW